MSTAVTKRLACGVGRDAAGDKKVGVDLLRALFREEALLRLGRGGGGLRVRGRISWPPLRDPRHSKLEGAILLASALEKEPERVMQEALMDIWLLDRSGLRDSGPGSIRGVAVTFLSAGGCRSPGILAKLLRDRARDQEFRNSCGVSGGSRGSNSGRTGNLQGVGARVVRRRVSVVCRPGPARTATDGSGFRYPAGR